MGMLNWAADLGIGTNDRRFPVVRLDKWVHPEFVHGIASGAAVPLKGAAVLRVTLLEGKTPETARPGPEIFVRCKIAARGTSDDPCNPREKVPFETCSRSQVSPGRSGTPATFTRARSWRTRFQLRSASQSSGQVGSPPDSINTVSSPCYHVVESWDIEKMMEEPPTNAYYEALAKDLRDRHKKACPHLLDHLVSLEAFLDKSILFGFSFGINKAEVCVAEGRLLGHKIGRNGSAPDEELPGGSRLPPAKGEVAHTAVLRLRELAPWVPPCGVRSRSQGPWPVAEARGSVPGGRVGFSRL